PNFSHCRRASRETSGSIGSSRNFTGKGCSFSVDFIESVSTVSPKSPCTCSNTSNLRRTYVRWVCGSTTSIGAPCAASTIRCCAFVSCMAALLPERKGILILTANARSVKRGACAHPHPYSRHRPPQVRQESRLKEHDRDRTAPGVSACSSTKSSSYSPREE